MSVLGFILYYNDILDVSSIHSIENWATFGRKLRLKSLLISDVFQIGKSLLMKPVRDLPNSMSYFLTQEIELCDSVSSPRELLLSSFKFVYVVKEKFPYLTLKRRLPAVISPCLLFAHLFPSQRGKSRCRTIRETSYTVIYLLRRIF